MVPTEPVRAVQRYQSLSSLTELRQDPFTHNWIVLAPGRSQRPRAFIDAPHTIPSAEVCPFCPGHEAETPTEIVRIDGADGHWRMRVVPNKFAMLGGGIAAERRVSPGGFVSMPGVGWHEVVIESRDHGADLAWSSVADVCDVLLVYRDRYRALRRSGAALIIVFRNHGPAAGTSLAHPHSQIIAPPVVPPQIRQQFDIAMRHYDDAGTCLYLDVLERELAEGSRIVLETDNYVAFAPFASAASYETWIMPRIHQSSFGEVSDQDLQAFASVLRSVLGGLGTALGDPDYNYVIHSAPPGDEGRQYFIWHLRIVPRLTIPAGFELGSGMRVNPILPEDAAAVLRNVVGQAYV